MAHAFTDRWGCPVFAGRQQAVDLLDEAVEQLVSLGGDPLALADEAAASHPDLVLARVLQAYLALYAGSASGRQRARALVSALDPCGLETGERELLHVLAVQSWADGEWERAAGFLERALLRESRDLLALKVAQDLYFFIGNQQDLLGVVERVVGAWPSDRPGYGYVCGMYAFGLEENGQYDAAEQQAGKALEQNPRDVWAVHAQAHIFEMEGSQRLGVAFLDRSVDAWSSSYFATHNWWHRALTTLSFEKSTRLWPSTTAPSAPPGRASGSTWTTRRRCCGVCSSSGSPSAIVPERCSRMSRNRCTIPSPCSMTGTR